MTTDARIADYYTTGSLSDRFRQALRHAGGDPDHASPTDLYNGDEFHVGGAEATEALVDQLGLASGMHVLDIGAGVGGPARLIAHRCGCKVTGIDLTPEFVATAGDLSEMVGLADRTHFLEGSGTEMPLEDGTFDAAVMFHVGMNIADKPALFRETARVLKPAGVFGIYDLMVGAKPGDLDFPVPWAKSAETSFVARPDDYQAAAEAAGFHLSAKRDRWQYGLDFMHAMAERSRAEGPAPLGPHLFMGASAKERLGNVIGNLERQHLAPVEMIFRKADA